MNRTGIVTKRPPQNGMRQRHYAKPAIFGLKGFGRRARRFAHPAKKSERVLERCNIVSECDLVEAAKKLNALHTTVRLKPDTTYDGDGHNLATVTHRSKSRRRMSLGFLEGKGGGAARI